MPDVSTEDRNLDEVAEKDVQFWQQIISQLETDIASTILLKNMREQSEFLEEYVYFKCNSLAKIADFLENARRRLSHVQNNRYKD